MNQDWPLLPGDRADDADTSAAAHTDETAVPRTCPSCGAAGPRSAGFCEACGAALDPLSPPQPTAQPTSAPPSGSTQTRRLGARHSQLTICPECGGSIDADGYCQLCGSRAPSLRDHFRQSPAGWVGGVCDRGRVHHRNEDSMALWADWDRAVLVVCDGVSSSIDSDIAAQAAARTTCEHLVDLLAGGEDLPDAVVEAALHQAVQVANLAVVASTDPDSSNAAATTIAVAVVVGTTVYFANLGDSRVYVLCAGEQLLVSQDDSMAQAFIEQGMPRAEAEALPRAHAITRWLGRDSTDSVPRIGRLTLTGPGWVLVCSDGLWNYASSPSALAALLPGRTPVPIDATAVAADLVDWANEQGGRDNITAALAYCPASLEPAGESGSSGKEEEQRENG